MERRRDTTISPTRSAGSSAPQNPVLMIPSTFFFSFRCLDHQRLGPGHWRPSTSDLPASALRRRTLRPAKRAWRSSPKRFRIPSNSRRSAATSSQVFTISIRPKPLRRAPQRFHRRPGRISQLARGLVVPHPHFLARHAHRVERRPRLLAGHRGPAGGRHSRRVRHRIGNPHRRRRPSRHFCQLSKNLLQRQVLAAQDVALARLARARTPARCPAATSPTSTTFNPVSRYAGIAPRKKSTTILPVGVGLKS